MQHLERLEQTAQRLPKLFELFAVAIKGALAVFGLLVLMGALVATGVFRSEGGIKAFGLEYNWKGIQAALPATTDQTNYVSVSELKNEFTWVNAKCGERNERAVSGACTIDPKSRGWMLQGAGIQDIQTWGCLFGRSVFVRDADLPKGKDDQAKLAPAELADAVGIAPKVGRAAARVLCAKSKEQ
jgi:hypothetical protein